MSLFARGSPSWGRLAVAMSDRPWLEDADPSLRVERALLKRLNAQEPPVGSIDQGWTALASEIAGLQALGSQGASPTEVAHVAAHGVKGAGLALSAKIVVGAALAGGALWGGSALLKSDAASDGVRVGTGIPVLEARYGGGDWGAAAGESAVVAVNC